MMKRVMRTVSLLCACAMLTSMQASAYEVYYEEDFESKATGAATTAFVGTGVREENGNKFAYVQERQEDWNYIYRLDAASDPITDTERNDESAEIFISADFMIPSMAGDEENDLREAQLVMSRWDTSGINNRAAVWYVSDGTERKLVAGHQGTAAQCTAIAEGVEFDKWYNVFIAIDWNEGAVTGDGRPKYHIYMNDTEKLSGQMGNQSGTKNHLGRIFQSNANRHSGSPNSASDPLYYLDNIKIVNTNDSDYELDLSYFKARSLAVNAEAGYTDGKVPQNMIDRLMSACVPGSAELDNEISIFKGAVIDTENGDDTTAAFVRINAGGTMPSQTAVEAGGLAMPLEAGVYTQKNNLTDGDISWSVKNADGTDADSTKLSIDDDGSGGMVLNIAEGFEGDLVLTAAATRDDGVVLSDTHSLGVVSARTVTVNSMVCGDGEIRLEGSFSDTVAQAVNICADGDDGDDSTATRDGNNNRGRRQQLCVEQDSDGRRGAAEADNQHNGQ